MTASTSSILEEDVAVVELPVPLPSEPVLGQAVQDHPIDLQHQIGAHPDPAPLALTPRADRVKLRAPLRR